MAAVTSRREAEHGDDCVRAVTIDTAPTFVSTVPETVLASLVLLLLLLGATVVVVGWADAMMLESVCVQSSCFWRYVFAFVGAYFAMWGLRVLSQTKIAAGFVLFTQVL